MKRPLKNSTAEIVAIRQAVEEQTYADLMRAVEKARGPKGPGPARHSEDVVIRRVRGCTAFVDYKKVRPTRVKAPKAKRKFSNIELKLQRREERKAKKGGKRPLGSIKRGIQRGKANGAEIVRTRPKRKFSSIELKLMRRSQRLARAK